MAELLPMAATVRDCVEYGARQAAVDLALDDQNVACRRESWWMPVTDEAVVVKVLFTSFQVERGEEGLS